MRNRLIAVMAATVLVASAGWALAEDKKESKPKEVELSGALACGHCKFKVGEGCSAAFKAGDGNVYIIKQPTKEIMQARFKGSTVKVTGTVEEKDGTRYVTASKAELVK
jgi:hypothetical protein